MHQDFENERRLFSPVRNGVNREAGKEGDVGSEELQAGVTMQQGRPSSPAVSTHITGRPARSEPRGSRATPHLVVITQVSAY